ncbi:MAG: DUF5676 family membrane protein [Candidatus Harrisonbacteria bacterium]|nr:DUF5676 family membrane protein [Candidatus Harrisonbacteria bacterium]
MRINAKSFANAATLVTVLLFIVFYLLQLAAPVFFSWLFNAQFFGADVASLVPAAMSFGSFLGTLVGVAVLAWLMTYLIIYFYNRNLK